MQNKVSQNKEKHSRYAGQTPRTAPAFVKKPISISQLLNTGGARLGALKERMAAREHVLDAVHQSLPRSLAEHVVSAGIDQGRLTVGVASAAWAARLRYATAALRLRVSASLGLEIHSVRIRVLPPSPPPPR